MNLREKEIKLKKPNNKYMKAYIKAVEKGYSKLQKQGRYVKNLSKD